MAKGLLGGAGKFPSTVQKWKKEEGEGSLLANNEPTSVLDTRRSSSPSPPSSTSTFSSPLTDNYAGVAAVSGNALQTWPISERKTTVSPTDLSAAFIAGGGGDQKDEWLSDFQPPQTGFAMEDLESMILETDMAEVEGFGLKQMLQSGNSNEVDGDVIHSTNTNFPFPSSLLPVSSSQAANFKASTVMLNNNFNQPKPVISSSQSSFNCHIILPPSPTTHQQILDEKSHILNQQLLINQNPNLFLPLMNVPQEAFLPQPQLKRLNSGISEPCFSAPKISFSSPHFLPHQNLRQKQMVIMKQEEEHHNLLNQLIEASEQIGSGNFVHAQGILARLNHQLLPVGKPLQRAAFYFKEALQLLLLHLNNPPLSKSPTPFDSVFKMGAYKYLSEISPLLQFSNFTLNQALLEALEDADFIHIIDFDIGFGVQWASFMQELPFRKKGACSSLKITAFASPSTHHALELGLMQENLMQFAKEIGIRFELEVINFDSFDPNSYPAPVFRSSDNETIAVNFPVWICSQKPALLPFILRFTKQLSPKIVVSLDSGCDRVDLPFSHHFLHALQYYAVLFDSLDAANVNSDGVNKIERFIFQSRIESTVLGRLGAPDKMPVWKALFASAGFSPLTFSNFSETQADYVLKRYHCRGFHVEKIQASLVLCWQQKELISASAWRC